jgi:hypothetical protein
MVHACWSTMPPARRRQGTNNAKQESRMERVVSFYSHTAPRNKTYNQGYRKQTPNTSRCQTDAVHRNTYFKLVTETHGWLGGIAGSPPYAALWTVERAFFRHVLFQGCWVIWWISKICTVRCIYTVDRARAVWLSPQTTVEPQCADAVLLCWCARWPQQRKAAYKQE